MDGFALGKTSLQFGHLLVRAALSCGVAPSHLGTPGRTHHHLGAPCMPAWLLQCYKRQGPTAIKSRSLLRGACGDPKGTRFDTG